MARRPVDARGYWAVLALCTLSATSLGDPAPGPPIEVQPAPEQWIARIPDDAPEPRPGWHQHRMAQWVAWPSDEYIAARQPPRDRRAEFPSVYPDGDRRLPPSEAGASSIRSVRSGCASWLRHLLKPEFIPENLEASLVLLQEEDPGQSWVACRLRANGTAVQFVDHGWLFCVVIRPDPALVGGLPPEKVGPAALGAVLNRGGEAADDELTPVLDVSEGLWAFEAKGDDGWGFEWWRRYFWYTDGHAVAGYFRGNDGGPSMPSPGDPWF